MRGETGVLCGTSIKHLGHPFGFLNEKEGKVVSVCFCVLYRTEQLRGKEKVKKRQEKKKKKKRKENIKTKKKGHGKKKERGFR
jgi:hypothetical protein